MTNIFAIRTGSVRIKKAQRGEAAGGMLGVLAGRQWTDWLPIYAWLIEHEEGLFLVDTGETARTAEPDYFTRWHPYYRLGLRMDVRPEDEIGPQLRRMGISPSEIRAIVLTHLHTDHAGGLHHFPNATIYASAGEIRKARGFTGQARGYLPHRWPAWFTPQALKMEEQTLGPFTRSFSLTSGGDIAVVPTPGHTRDHVSVVVRSSDRTYFLAGDTSYTQAQLMRVRPDGISPDRLEAAATMERILALGSAERVVYLPSHDPDAARRLAHRIHLPVYSQPDYVLSPTRSIRTVQRKHPSDLPSQS